MPSICVRTPPSLVPTSGASAVNNRNHKICFRHPAYPEPFDQNVLIILYAFDSPEGGLHVGTARLCCGIVACNAYNGYFTETRTGPKLQLADDEILTGSSYYFHVPQDPNYAIYRSFWHWAYPHNPSAELQALWPALGSRTESQDIQPVAPPSASNATAAVLRRDQSCRVSGHRDYVERAHLCPRSESDWFRVNAMYRYNDNQELAGEWITDDISNAFCLRSDIHSAFDDRKFIIAWKDSQWVVHFMQLTHELGSIYHNTRVTLDPGVAPAFLLARLAWTVFPLLGKFFDLGIQREVCLRVKEEHGFKEVVKSVGGEELARLEITERGRSSSPKKRKAPPIPETSGTQIKRCRTSNSSFAPSSSSSSPSSSSISKGTPPPNYFDVTTIDPTRGSSTPATPATEEEYMATLKRHERQKRRPSSPRLLCCDYTFAEQASKLGLPGKREYGGAYLCSECLGAEYDHRDDADWRGLS